MEEAFEKMLPLFRKAAETPDLITRAEKNVLQYRPLPDKEDAAIKARTSCDSFADLVHKCLSDGVSAMTDVELNILAEGVQPALLSTANAMSSIQQKQSANIQATIEKAYENLSDPDEDRAMLLATEEINHRAQLERAKLRSQRATQTRHQVEQSARAVAAAKFAPFPDHATRSASEAIQRFALKAQPGNLPTFSRGAVWGFACFRTNYDDDATWQNFKARLDSIARKELQRLVVPEEMREGFRFIYIENEQELSGGLDQKRLSAFFARIRDDEATLPHGIDREFFISVDDAVLRAFVHAVDPVIILHDAKAGAATPTNHFPGYSGVTVIQFFTLSLPGIERNRNHMQSLHSLTYG